LNSKLIEKNVGHRALIVENELPKVRPCFDQLKHENATAVLQKVNNTANPSTFAIQIFSAIHL
jgi:hypothetical protein